MFPIKVAYSSKYTTIIVRKSTAAGSSWLVISWQIVAVVISS